MYYHHDHKSSTKCCEVVSVTFCSCISCSLCVRCFSSTWVQRLIPTRASGGRWGYVCMHACMHACMYVCMWSYLHESIYVITSIYIYICVYIYTCIMGIYPPIWYDMIIYSKLIGPDVCPEMGALPPASWPWLKNNRWCLPTHDVFLRDLIYPQLVH